MKLNSFGTFVLIVVLGVQVITLVTVLTFWSDFGDFGETLKIQNEERRFLARMGQENEPKNKMEKNVNNLSESKNKAEKDVIVAIPDVHGDLNQTMRSLRLANIIDRQGHWTGGRSVLVQLGDIFDRGHQVKECIEFFINLKKEATEAGGEIIQLIGNHDWLNLDDKDTGPITDYEYEQYGGKEKRKIAISMEGIQGRYMRLNGKAWVIINNNLFAHAGVEPHLAKMNVNYVNTIFGKALQKNLPGNQWPDVAKIIGGGGSFWTREFAITGERTEKKVCELLEKTLEITGAERMVIGHNRFSDSNTQKNLVRRACDDRLIDLDIGLSDPLGGFAIAMVIDKITNNFTIEIQNCTWKGIYNPEECSTLP